jgi:hypothetical protein
MLLLKIQCICIRIYLIYKNVGIWCFGGVCTVALFMWAEFSVFSLYGEWQVTPISIYPVLKILHYYISTYTYLQPWNTEETMDTFYQRQHYLQVCCTYIHRNSTKTPRKKYEYPTQNTIQYIHNIYMRVLYTYLLHLQLYKFLQLPLGNFNYTDHKCIHSKLHIQKKQNMSLVLHVYTWR